MEQLNQIPISNYLYVSSLNPDHKIDLVKDMKSGLLFVKKEIDVYNIDIYKHLHHFPVVGIPRIYAIEEKNDHLTVIEEYLKGEDLSALLEKHDLSEEYILYILLSLCDILNRLHKINPPIVHRDIKPSNIRITNTGTIYLIDFNAAKYALKNQTRDTIRIGTEGYAAPEQYGFGASTPQTDIYALGVLMRELLTNGLGQDTLSPKWQSIITKCNEMNPKDRYQNVEKLKADLLSTEKKCKKPQRHSPLIPPGYRTRTPWKMAFATLIYAFLIWLGSSVKYPEKSPVYNYVDKVFACLFLLSFVFGTFNYLNVQNLNPLCKSRYLILRILGILMIDALLALLVLILTTITESILP